ncbi:MAG TPA: hypothetical protein VNO30_44665 [Kofleriaceae bacterium]|nr:hypothetical protein [Kofleriaceae bacterium]
MPQPRGLAVSLNTTAAVRANVQVQVQPPPPPQPAVEIRGAPVVEFFGIPLEGSPDVVFVLDCSGSMSAQAQGRIAQLGPAAGPAPVGPAPVGPAPVGPAPPPDPADGSTPPAAAPPPDAAPPVAAPPVASSKIDVAREELVDAIQRLAAGTQMNVIFFSSGVEAFAPSMVPLEEGGRDRLIAFVREMTAAGSTALAPAMRIAFLMNARRIVLLSDGLGNVGGNAGVLLRDAREAMRGGVRIDTIGLGRDQDAALLQTLAGESGGIYQSL